MSVKSPLRVLADIISSTVAHIDDEYAAAGLVFPTLDEAFDPTQSANTLLFDPGVLRNMSIVVAAAEQLSVTIRPPAMVAFDLALSHIKSSCLQTAVVTCVPEILREAGPKGLHVKHIAGKNGMDPEKLSRVLRLLATGHIFTEVEPNVYTNNRVSSVLDTTKPSSNVLPGSESKVQKFLETDGVAALVEYFTEDILKAGAYMTETLVNSTTSHSNEITDTPLNRAFNTSDSFYVWMNRPENEYRRIRFDMAMHGSAQTEAKDSILKGFPWDSLSDGSKVVDVGGGIGAVSLQIAKKYPKLKFVVQDLITAQTEAFWDNDIPGSVECGRLVVQEQDFFTPQPIKDADIFLVRGVVHNWPAMYAIKLLKHLREAAIPGKTRLLVVDMVVHYACKGGRAETEYIPGSTPPPVPEPLLPNLGRAFDFAYKLDLLNLIVQNGQERTLVDHVHITKESGWKITRVYSSPGSVFRHIVAETV